MSPQSHPPEPSLIRPLYQRLKAARVSYQGDGNLGLYYTRFFDQWDSKTWTVPDSGKPEWIRQTVKAATPDGRILAAQEGRTRALAKTAGGEVRLFETTWRFVTGLGLPHPVENGFLWHPTLGVPYLPGTSVKGLLHAWIEEWAGLDEEPKKELSLRWFGNTDQAGDLVFFDALPTVQPKLVADVMTPHTGKWQEKGQEITDPRSSTDADKVPADWHSPNPVPFLVVQDAKFLFAIGRRHPRVATVEVENAFRQLELALRILGAGAKTAVGYGRMVPEGTLGQYLPFPPRVVSSQPGESQTVPGFEPRSLQGLSQKDKTSLVQEWIGKLQRQKPWTPEDKAAVAVQLREILMDMRLWESPLRWNRDNRQTVERWLPREGES